MCRKLKISEHAQKSQLFKILIAIFNMAIGAMPSTKYCERSERIEN